MLLSTDPDRLPIFHSASLAEFAQGDARKSVTHEHPLGLPPRRRRMVSSCSKSRDIWSYIGRFIKYDGPYNMGDGLINLI